MTTAYYPSSPGRRLSPLAPMLIIIILLIYVVAQAGQAMILYAEASRHALQGHGAHAQKAIDCFSDPNAHYLGQYKMSFFGSRYLRACMDPDGRIALDFMDKNGDNWERVTSYFKQRFEGDRQAFMRWLLNGRATKFTGLLPW